MNPRAASGDSAWRRHVATVPRVQMASPAIPGFLRVCFCNFYMLEYGFKLLLVVLFNFYICLTCNYIWVYEKNIMKRDVCVFVLFLCY
jgi:hypothetical protein